MATVGPLNQRGELPRLIPPPQSQDLSGDKTPALHSASSCLLLAYSVKETG